MHRIEQIPQLKKKQRKKKTNQKIILFLFLFFISLLVLLFFRSPLNKINEIVITGNQLLTDRQVIETSQLKVDMPFFGTDTEEVESKISQLPPVEKVKVEKDFPGQIRVKITEYQRVAFSPLDNGKLVPLLSNGKILSSDYSWQGVVDRPIIRQFEQNELLQTLASELSLLDQRVLGKISEIQRHPIDSDHNRLQLFMKDGYEVQTSVQDFSKNMAWYPSFIAYLKQQGQPEGIVTLLEGKWFVPYETASPEQQEEHDILIDQNGEDTTNESP